MIGSSQNTAPNSTNSHPCTDCTYSKCPPSTTGGKESTSIIKHDIVVLVDAQRAHVLLDAARVWQVAGDERSGRHALRQIEKLGAR